MLNTEDDIRSRYAAARMWWRIGDRGIDGAIERIRACARRARTQAAVRRLRLLADDLLCIAAEG